MKEPSFEMGRENFDETEENIEVEASIEGEGEIPEFIVEEGEVLKLATDAMPESLREEFEKEETEKVPTEETEKAKGSAFREWLKEHPELKKVFNTIVLTSVLAAPAILASSSAEARGNSGAYLGNAVERVAQEEVRNYESQRQLEYRIGQGRANLENRIERDRLALKERATQMTEEDYAREERILTERHRQMIENYEQQANFEMDRLAQQKNERRMQNLIYGVFDVLRNR